MIDSKNYIYSDNDIEVPVHLNFGKYMLDRLRQKSDEIAIENAETKEKITYKEFTQYSVDLATALQKLGVKKGATVAVGTEKRNLFVPTVLGVVLTGATYTPYDLQSGRAVLKHKLEITKPQYFICSKLFWKSYSDIIRSFETIGTIISLDFEDKDVILIYSLINEHTDVNSFEPAAVEGHEDVVFILYSSGTTGMPKGVLLTHLNCIRNSWPDDFKEETLQTALVFGEWYHNYDTFMTYKMLSLGRKIVYVNDVTCHTILKAIEDCHVNIAMLVPAVVCQLSKVDNISDYNIDSLKIMYSRSSPLHEKTMILIKQRFPKLGNILQGYGMTEAGELTSESWATVGPKSGSVGKATPGIILKISDITTDETLGPLKKGEIRVKGHVLMKGYIGIDPSTYLDKGGFLKTGDLGYYDEDQYFFIVDRLKDIINYEGNKVAPLELETILQLHPGVKEAAVVGKPDPVSVEKAVAFVVRQVNSKITEQDLNKYVASEVPPYMQLHGGIKFVSKLPRNPRGKVLRKSLKEMFRYD